MFIKDYGKFGRPFGELPIDRVRQLLEKRGIPFDDSAEIQYEMIRAEMKGRKAIGTLAVSAAAGLFLSDRLTGNGIYDNRSRSYGVMLTGSLGLSNYLVVTGLVMTTLVLLQVT